MNMIYCHAGDITLKSVGRIVKLEFTDDSTSFVFTSWRKEIDPGGHSSYPAVNCLKLRLKKG